MADKLVELWTKDWRRLRHQKHRHRGGVEAGMLLDYLLYEGEHQSIQVQNSIVTRAFKHERDKNKLRLVINLARRAVDRKIGREFGIAHEYKATPNTKDPDAFDMADVVGDQLIPALDYKLQQHTLRWELAAWRCKLGVVFEHVDWKDAVTQDVMPKRDEASGEMVWKDSLTGVEIPESQVQLLLQSGRVAGERFSPAVEVSTEGDVGADVYDPFRVFVDASVKQVKFLGPDQAIYLADIRTVEWVRENFGSDIGEQIKKTKDLSIIETQLLDRGMPVQSLNLKDLLPLIHGSQDKDDPDQCIILTRYQPPNKQFPQGQRSFFVPDQVVIDTDVLPYPEIPVIDYHWSAPTSTMWTTGFLRDMQSLSKFINKRYSQMGEAANAQIYEMLLLAGGLTKKDIPTDFPGVVEEGINQDTGAPNVQVVPRGNLPAFFPESIRMSMETMDAIASSDLLSQRKFPGQMRGSLAIPMVQEILDSEDGPRYYHIAEQFSREKQMRINRVKQFYPPIRTLNYTGGDMRQEVLELHTDELLRAGVDFTITVDPGSIFPELPSMREARVRERFSWAPGLYTSPRTQTVDWSKIAHDLKYKDTFRDGIAAQGRKLARALVKRARSGKLVVIVGPPNPETGKPVLGLVDAETQQPFIIYPFWAHNEMMDEYESVMNTTEFIDSSPTFKRTMLTLHEAHRTILSQIDQARQNAVEAKMQQGAMAQAAQQTAARVASVAAEAAVEQVMAQKENLEGDPGTFASLQEQIRQLMGGMQAQGQPPGQTQERPMGHGPQLPQRRV